MASIQTGLFLIFVLDGIIIGVLFDFFRILRKSFVTGNIITAIEDIIFWLLSGILILYSIFTYNNGIIRGYMFLGVLCGALLYMLTISKLFIKINVIIISFIKKAISIILRPIKWILDILKNIFLKPVSAIFIRINKILKKFIIKILKFSKKAKNKNMEKDFTKKCRK